jgi:hypothetical protein
MVALQYQKQKYANKANHSNHCSFNLALKTITTGWPVGRYCIINKALFKELSDEVCIKADGEFLQWTI